MGALRGGTGGASLPPSVVARAHFPQGRTGRTSRSDGGLGPARKRNRPGWDRNSKGGGISRDGGIRAVPMDDGSRKRRSEKSTAVAPGVYVTTMSASMIERSVEWAETVHGNGSLRPQPVAGRPPAGHGPVRRAVRHTGQPPPSLCNTRPRGSARRWSARPSLRRGRAPGGLPGGLREFPGKMDAPPEGISDFRVK